MKDIELETFLWYGYLPMPSSGAISMHHLKRENMSRVSIQELVKKGIRVWQDAVEASLISFGQDIAVPLSGGLDSRAILAGLLEHMSPSEIQTYTFGVPGTYDYEIGNLVAREAKTKHYQFDLSLYQYSFENLLDISQRVAGRTVLFQHAPISLIERRYSSKTSFWVGFMGDPLTGSHLLHEDSAMWDTARTRFVARNRYSRSVILSTETFDPEFCLPESPLLDFNIICFDEQLDFSIRQECYVKPLVLLKGYRYATPFLYPQWINFILSVPRQYRKNQLLYKQILKGAYPRFFSLPVKNNLGLPLTAPRWRRAVRRNVLRARVAAKRFIPLFDSGVWPSINYIDFDHGLRERQDLKTVVYENIHDLKKRNIVDWIDTENIWNCHQQCKGNYADALTLLASLEINLKAQEVRVK